MELIKKILFYTLVAGALIFGIWAYFNLKNSKKPKMDAFRFVPADCAFYFRTNHLIELNTKLNSQSLIMDKVMTIKGTEGFFNKLQSFAALLDSNELLKTEFENNNLHFAHFGTEGDWLMCFNLKELGDQNIIAERLETLLKTNKTENDLCAFQVTPFGPLFYFLHEGAVFVAPKAERIQQALDPKTPKLYAQSEYASYASGFEEQELLSVYVNHSIYTKSTAATKIHLNAFSKKGISLGHVDVQPSQLSITGYLKPDTNEVISALLHQRPQAIDFLNVLPLNTVLFKAYGFHNYVQLLTELGVHQKKDQDRYWRLVEDTAMYNVKEAFYGNLKNALIEFNRSSSNHNYLLCSITDTVKALEQLGYMSDRMFDKNIYRIYKLRRSGPEDLRLFQPISKQKCHYAMIIEDYILFAENEEAVSDYVETLGSKADLTANSGFMNYKTQQLPDEYNVLLYAAPCMVPEKIPTFFNFKSATSAKVYKHFKHFSFALTARNSDFKFRWQLQHESSTETENENEKQPVLWTMELDTSSSIIPTRFVNHLSGENELLVQDDANGLYLADAKGNRLWKKHLKESINSEIYTVDIFKNNKYQLLFSTAHYLHLIDRKGNYVEGYPVKLPSEITSGLAVFDYDSSKDYRLFFACKNNKIYNYNIYGIKQEGFNPFKTDATIRLPLQYIKVGASDYIVGVDEEGKIYTISRKGEGRIGLTNRSVTHCKAFYMDISNSINSSYLIYVDDKNGWINKISLSDKKEIIQLKSEGEQKEIRFSLVDENRNMDLVLTSATNISAYNLNGNRLFDRPNDKSFRAADFYSDESHAFYYALSVVNNELVVFDQLQQKTKNYSASSLPLICNLFKDNKSYLIFSDHKRVCCVAY